VQVASEPELNLPITQSKTFVALIETGVSLSLAVYLPAAAAVQTLRPTASAYLPLTQSVHCGNPSNAVMDPFGHCKQTPDSPDSTPLPIFNLYLPEEQAVHEAADAVP
jgi:hypothetical protein